jgi:nanoRNase/pAp phosphatase (c-di-AMP/oligoRNAs hydrolase)
MGNDVFISARSDGSINVQLIMEAMNGGGHYAAAATMLKETTPNDAITQLCIEIRRYFNEISKETHDNPPRSLIREIHALIGKKQSKPEQNK